MHIAQTPEKTIIMRTGDKLMAQSIVSSFLKEGEQYTMITVDGDVCIMEAGVANQYTLTTTEGPTEEQAKEFLDDLTSL